MAFDAFISYSHAADGRLAPAVQRAIQRLAKPWYRQRALHVFRDESALSANPHLWSSIQSALDDAEWFVLLASPDAVASEWVARELTHWLANKSPDRILVVLTDGTWDWDAESHTLNGSAVPAALRDAFGDEPRHVDLRWAATETDLDMHHARFRDVIAQLAAPMHGIAKDDLDSEDVRQHRRTRRLARGGVTVLTLLVVVSLITTTFAVVQRGDAVSARGQADQRANIATAQQLAAVSINTAATDPRLALLLAADGIQRQDSPATRAALLGALTRNPQLVGFMPGATGATSQSAISPDGSVVATGASDGSVSFWHSDGTSAVSRRVAPPGTLRGTSVVGLTFDSSGRRLYALYEDFHVQAWDVERETPAGPPIRFVDDKGAVFPTALAVSPDGHYLAVVMAGFFTEVGEWDLRAGRAVGVWGRTDNDTGDLGGVAYSADSATMYISAQQGLLAVDAKTLQLLPRVISATPLPPGVTCCGDFLVAPLAGATVGRGRSLLVNGNEVIDLRTRKIAVRLNREGPLGAFLAPPVALSTDGTFAIEGANADGVNDGTINVVDTSTGQPLGPSLHAPGGQIVSLSLSHAHRLAATTEDGTTELWDLVGDGGAASSPPFDGLARRTSDTASPGLFAYKVGQNEMLVALSPDGRRVAAVSAPNLEIRARAGSGPVVNDIVPKVAFTSCAFDGCDALSAGPLQFDPSEQQLRYDSKLFAVSLAGPARTSGWAQPVGGLVSPDPGFASSSTEGWMNGPSRDVVVQLGTSNAFAVVDMWSGRTISKLQGDAKVLAGLATLANDAHTQGLPAATVDIQGRHAVTLTSTGFALWDARSGKLVGSRVLTSTGNETEIGAVAAAFSPDGNELAVSRSNGTLLRYAVPSLRPIGSAISGPDGTLAYQPHGSLLAAVRGTSVDLIDRSVGEVVATIPLDNGPSGLASTVQFDASGNTLLTQGWANSHPTLLWSMVPSDWLRTACRIAGRNLTRTEWKQLVGSVVPYRRTCPQWPAGT